MKTQSKNSIFDNGFIPKFSFFKCPITNIVPCSTITILDAYNLIKGDKYITQTEKLRSIRDKETARRYKAQSFDYACFSGIFSKRNDNSLIKHSGLLTIDFDNVSDLNPLKESLLNDKYFETELMFKSPSGKGLKWIFPVNFSFGGTHQQWFSVIGTYIKITYGYEIDNSGKDISRACFLPFDPEVYINPIYTLL